MDTTKSAFNIKSVKTEGYNKVNFLIKNDLIRKGNNLEAKDISLKIETKRSKEVAEKNIKNEITKYKLIINSQIKIISLNNSKEISINVMKSGDYRVGTTSLNTSKNLDNLEKNLANEIVKEIKRKLIILNNDI